MADDPKAGTTKKDGDGAAATPDVNALIAGLEQKIEQKLNQTAQALNGSLRSLYDRQLQALRSQLAELQGVRGDDGGGDDGRDPRRSSAPTRHAPDPYFERLRMNQEITEFKVDNPDYSGDPKVKAAVDALLADNARVHSVLAYNEEGLVDYRKTYRNALREVQVETLRASKDAADKAQREADTKRKSSKADATLSGGGTDEIPDEVLDKSPDDLTDEELDQLMGLRPKRKAPVGVATSR